MKRNKKRKFLFYVVLTAIIIFMASMMFFYITDPVQLQLKLNEITNKVEYYILELNGMKALADENMQMPEQEKLTEAQKYYYYQQLNDTGKLIYISIENNIEKIKNGEDNIPLPNQLNEIAKSTIDGKNVISTEFQNAWDAFITDKSEYFYLDSSKVCLVTKIITKGSNINYEFSMGKGQNANYFTDDFNSKQEVELAIQEIQKLKSEIIKNTNGNNYEKMLYIHNYIVENTTYDTSNTPNKSNVYGCLINKKAICEGYARAYKYLLDELNIPCLLVSGEAVDEEGNIERHAWNYVYINNNWYAVDTTWDDPIIIGNGIITKSIKYKYFLKGKKTMNKDHKTIGQITKDGFEFKYPELANDDL